VATAPLKALLEKAFPEASQLSAVDRTGAATISR
jgi:hypothetical protein